MVTREELKGLLQPHGWYLSLVKRHNSYFAYAKRRNGNTVISRYLKAESRFHELTEESVLRKIQP